MNIFHFLFIAFLTTLNLLPSTALAIDTDGDGLDDSVETNTGTYISPANTGTNPNASDTDSDGVDDGIEVALGTNPNDITESPLQKKILAGDAQANDEFGYSVDISGDTAVIGAYKEDTGAGDAGAIYVFTRTADVWSQQQKLIASTPQAGANLGYSVSIDGDTLVAGAHLEDHPGIGNAGAAYVFVRSGTVWTEQQRLTASDAIGTARFGNSVALDGDSILIGAPVADGGATKSGAVYAFTRTLGTWSEQQKIAASIFPNSYDWFGKSVALHNDIAVVGAPHATGYTGSAYTFTRTANLWGQEQRLTASNGDFSHSFGESVAIEGNWIAIGSPGEGLFPNPTGAVYVFFKNSGMPWGEQQKLTASDGQSGDTLGTSVDFTESKLIAGANNRDEGAATNSGAAYLFIYRNSLWTEQLKILASDAQSDDEFSRSVALDGDTAIIGAFSEDSGGSDAGTAYIVDFDVDNDGLINTVETDTGTFVNSDDTGTNPFDSDTDSDGLNDGEEVENGSDPVNPSSPNPPPLEEESVPLPLWAMVFLVLMLCAVFQREVRR